MNDRQRILQAITTTGIVMLAALVAGILMARVLGPAGRGTVAALVAWSAIATEIALFGTQQATVFFTADKGSGGLAPHWRHIVRYAVVEGLVAGLIFVAISVRLPRDGDLFWLLILVFSLRALASVHARHRRAFLQGSLDFTGFNAVRLLSEAGPSIVIIALAALGHLTAAQVSYAYLAGVVAALLVGLRLVDLRLRGSEPGSPAAGFDRRSYWRYAGRSYVSNLATWTNARVDFLALSLVAVGASSLGHYAVALTAGQSIAAIGYSVGLVTFPRVAAVAEVAARKRLVLRSVGFTAVISALCGLIIFVSARPLVVGIFGEEYADAVSLTRILVIGGVALSVSAVAGDALRGLDRVGVVAFAQVLGMAITLAAVVLWPIHEAIEYVAWGSTIGFSATATVKFVVLLAAKGKKRSDSIETEAGLERPSDSAVVGVDGLPGLP